MAGPRRRGSTRPDGRLDPVRWPRPGRAMMVRLAAIAALLVTAAMITWSGPQTCSAAPTSPASPAARAPVSAGAGSGSAGRTAAVDPSRGRATAATPDAGGRPAVPAGRVGVPIRLAEPTALTLIRLGDHVDLLRVGDAGEDSRAVAAGALVLGVTGADDLAAGGLLLALTPAEATEAVTRQGRGFAVLIRP
jgi:hypothetical protein